MRALLSLLVFLVSGCNWLLPLDKGLQPGVDAGVDADDALVGDADLAAGDAAADGGWCVGPGCPAPVQVAGGQYHTCALLDDRTVWCWGDGPAGQLGTGAPGASPRPVRVDLEPTLQVSELACGWEHCCVITGGGEVRCWGANGSWQVSGADGPDAARPVKVQGLPAGASALALGEAHGCALVGSELWCWGRNSRGQLAHAVDSEQDGVQLVTQLDSVSSVGCGEQHCCAVSGSELWCWGDSRKGQCGTVDKAPIITPVKVGLGEADELACGGNFCCARSKGAAWCWGENGVGQVDEKNQSDAHPLPFEVPGPSDVEELALGEHHACARTKAGELWCWGYDRYGQLGGGEQPQSVPLQVMGLAVTAIGAGNMHTCAVGTAGELWCWGRNIQGQVGNGQQARSAKPVLALTSVDQAAVGGQHTCALQGDKVQCWGYGIDGQLGNGGQDPQASPVVVSNSSPWKAVGAGGLHSCAVHSVTGEPWCWGANWSGHCGAATGGIVLSPQLAASGLDVQAIVGGHDHTCAATDSDVRCWGRDISGATAILPQQVLSQRPKAIAARGATTCVVDDGGQVLCWGSNGDGQLGDGSTTDSATPVVVADLPEPAVDVCVGGHHACAAMQGGAVYCWGENVSGQLGVPRSKVDWYTTTPVPVEQGPAGVVGVACGWYHTCALTGGGEVHCWGHNSAYCLGHSSSAGSSTPTRVQGLPTAVSVHAGWDHSCAVTAARELYCWGSFFFGQLGHGARSKTWTPVRVN